MPIQKGYDKGDQKRRDDRYTPNKPTNKQVVDAMRAAGVDPTDKNIERVHRAISGKGYDYHQLVAEIKHLFGK